MLLEYIEKVRYPEIDMEEFKNLEVNKELVELYEKKGRKR